MDAIRYRKKRIAPYGLPLWFAKLTAPWAHAIMERKQLFAIQQCVEAVP
jgi:hypothetical protein